MSDWVCVANNPQTGVSTWHKYEDDGVVIETRQDMGALLDENTAQRNIAEDNWKGDYHSVARLPSEMLYGKTYIGDAVRAEDDKAVSKFLNDIDNRLLRTKYGRV